MPRIVKYVAVVLIALATVGCEFRPTGPFSGFDSQGSRLVGHFGSGATSSLTSMQTGITAATSDLQGIEVLLREQPSLRVTVDADGSFVLVGIPSGSFTLVFLRNGTAIGEIRFRYVRKNQGITIVVVLTSGGEVVLVEEQRDQVSFSGECPRGAGFWCQNQGGKNPNLTQAEFDAFAREAAEELLDDVAALNTPDEIAAAVCNTGNQFARQLAALALNVAAGTVSRSTTLQGEQAPYTTVGAVLDAAVAHLTNASPLTAAEQQALKDVMDRINNAQSVESCNQLPDDDEGNTEEPPASGAMTICHIPPGNYNARHTITIDASAWPSHRLHCAQGTCDYTGGCR